jgi:hypothetical protein
MLYPNATEFPRLTASEEANIILQDIFDDADTMNDVLHNLCEEDGIAFDWDLNGDEIDALIIDNEDRLMTLVHGVPQEALEDASEPVAQEALV